MTAIAALRPIPGGAAGIIRQAWVGLGINQCLNGRQVPIGRRHHQRGHPPPVLKVNIRTAFQQDLDNADVITDCSVIYRRVSKFIDSVDLRIVPDQQLYEILQPPGGGKKQWRASVLLANIDIVFWFRSDSPAVRSSALTASISRSFFSKSTSARTGTEVSTVPMAAATINLAVRRIYMGKMCSHVVAGSRPGLVNSFIQHYTSNKLTNRRKTPMRPYQAVLIATTGLIVAAIAAFVLYGGGGSGGRGIAAIGGPFTLTDQTGKTRTERDFHGSYNLIYFGYTFCPDVCPTALQVMTSAMDRLDKGMQAKITPIFITIDPTRDTVEQLAAYVENFHPRMIGLTGTEEQVVRRPAPTGCTMRRRRKVQGIRRTT